jgi:hypothetical protein
MVATAVGIKRWRLTRDRIGHRNYNATFRVTTDSYSDGPLTVFSAAGLPSIGTFWEQGDEFDSWAFCSPEATVRPMVDNEANNEWEVDMLFTTLPIWRCQDTTIQDPLSEPMKIGGSFVRYTWSPQKDRNGDPIIMSNLEPIIGALNEFDRNRPTVWIEFNVLDLGLENFAPMIDTVNDSELWGLPVRCVKLSNVTWTRLTYGVCTFYYKLRFEFDIRYQQTAIDDTLVGGFDNIVIDQGKLVLPGIWSNASPPVWTPTGVADPKKATSYVAFKDFSGELRSTWLDGDGNPNQTEDQVENVIEYYPESNFLTLGIPSTL